MAYLGILLKVALLAIAAGILKRYEIHQTLKTREKFSGLYDYIVIGGGTAGSVVASRLANTSALLRVLVLEEGGLPSVNNDIPAEDVLNILLPTETLDQFLVEKQTASSFGFPNHQFKIVTGRILGGGSGVNGMMYNRGGKDDYDGWVKDYKCHGWSYLDVLKYFKKSEDQTDPALINTPFYHSTGGPLGVTSPNISMATLPYQTLSNMIVDAAKEKGFQETDINGANSIGVTRIQRTVRNGLRDSAANAFLEPLADLENLNILTGARVTKIIFEGSRAVGVTFDYHRKSHTVYIKAKGEIILSAGSINSPKLLMLSGVGPKAHLEFLKIPVVRDLPVGKNFQDHHRIGGVDMVCNQTLFSYWEDLLTVENLEALYTKGEGPLASQYYLHQAAVINFRTSVPDRGFLYGPADLFVAPALLPPGAILLAAGSVSLNDEIMGQYYGPFFGQPTLNMFTALNYVRSRGFVRLRSVDPYDPPLVDPAYLTNSDDLARVVEAYKFSQSLAETNAFKRLGCQPYELQVGLPGCLQFYTPGTSQQSDNYIKCKIRHLSASELHVSGSCRMTGIVNDSTAVLDPRLRVRGLQGIRVADVSIMPSVVSGNTMAPAIMIGEKAAAMILEDRQ